MRNLKRALSLALASVMLLGMMVVGTSAASYPDVKDSDNVEAIEVLNAVKVMVGDRGNFRPDSPVNRHEMAAIMARLYLGKDAAESYVGSHPFTDVYPWADKYVAACYENGLINGTSKTTFSGNQPLTAVQAAAMMLRALGYENLQKGATDWRVPVAAKANEIRLFKDVIASPNAQLTRNQVAQLALNTLKADVVTTSRVLVAEGGVLDNEFRYDKVTTGVGTGTDNYSVADGSNNASATDTGYGVQQLCEKLYGTDLRLKGSNTDDLKHPASEWQYKKDGIIKVADEADYVLVMDDDYTGKSSLLTDVIRELSGNDDLVYKASDSTINSITANTTTTFALNGVTVAAHASNTESTMKGAAAYGTVMEIYLDSADSKAISKVVATSYTLDKITEVDTDVKSKDADKGVTAYVTFKNAGTFNDDKIAGFNAETYEKDAYVAVIEKNDGTEILASYIPEVVESSVSTVKNNKFITAGGDKYYPTANYASSVETITLDGTNVSTKSDDSYAIYVDQYGYMLGLKEIEGSAASLDEVYYVDTVWEVEQGMSSRWYAQVVSLADGTKREVELEQKDHTAFTQPDLDDGSYSDYFACRGVLATVTDKKQTDSKAGNDKFNLIKWDNSVNDDFDVYTGVKFDMSTPLKLKADDSRVAVTNSSKNGASDATATFRLSSATKYVFLEKAAANLDVSTVTGGVNFTFSSTNMGTINTTDNTTTWPAIVITESDKTVAQYVVIPCAKAASTTGASKDVIFIESASSEKGDGYYSQDVYLANGTKETWKIDDGEYPALTGRNFYTYTENSDGYYELEKADPIGALAGSFWEDEPGAVGDDTYEAKITAKGARTEADGKVYLTVTVNSTEYKEIEVTDAVFVDAHDKDGSGEYDRAINSLERLCDLIDDAEDGKAGVNKTGTKLYLYVTKDGAQTIVLTDAPAKAAVVADTTAPSLSKAEITGTSLVLTYDETLSGSDPATTDFTVAGITAGTTVSSVAMSGTTVTLTMANAAVSTDTVTVSYTPGTNKIKDAAGNAAVALTTQAVTNKTVPTVASATVNGTSLTITFTESLKTTSPAASAFTVSGISGSPTVSSVSVSGTTVTLTLSSTSAKGETVTVSYTAPTGGTELQTTGGAKVASFTNRAVTNSNP